MLGSLDFHRYTGNIVEPNIVVKSGFCRYTVVKSTIVKSEFMQIQSSNTGFVQKETCFVFLACYLFSCLTSSAKDPTQKVTCRGDKFTASYHYEEN